MKRSQSHYRLVEPSFCFLCLLSSTSREATYNDPSCCGSMSVHYVLNCSTKTASNILIWYCYHVILWTQSLHERRFNCYHMIKTVDKKFDNIYGS